MGLTFIYLFEVPKTLLICTCENSYLVAIDLFLGVWHKGCISFLFLHNKFPKTLQVVIAYIPYLIISVGQEFGTYLGFSAPGFFYQAVI